MLCIISVTLVLYQVISKFVMMEKALEDKMFLNESSQQIKFRLKLKPVKARLK